MAKFKSQLRSTILDNWQLISILLVAITTIIACSLWQLSVTHSRVSMVMLNQAKQMSVTLSELRSFYTQEVVAVARQKGLQITHDYAENDTAIPLPATMSMILGNRVGELTGGMYSMLYSPYPFPWRDNAGLTDTFKKDAWQALSQNPQKPFYRFEELNNQQVLRYASSDIMRESCVDCHNAHPNSPKMDWKKGDLRGVLEVIVPTKDIGMFGNSSDINNVLYISLILLCSFAVIFVILIKLRNHNKQLEKLTLTDSLTGLYNRRKLIECLEHAINRAEKQSVHFGIAYFDLDDFKKINDSCGHAVGDQLLELVSRRIKSIIREGDILARVGGDEFVLLVELTEGVDQLKTLAKRIAQCFSTEYHLGNQEIFITSSVGLTDFQSGEKNSEELIKNADVAMYKAKDVGRNCYHIYSKQMSEILIDQLQMERDIRAALRNGEFTIFYQPKIDPLSGKIHGAEALIRWVHPQKGIISPAEFIHIAERSDLIIEIGEWVREQVCRQLCIWKGNNFPRCKVSVNVSGKEFIKFSVLQNLIDLLSKYDFDQRLLEIEITENTLMEASAFDNMLIRVIQNMDIGLSIDDFGTGYCSLGYLKRYPVDTLKIDKSFIDTVHGNKRDAELVSTIIAMAHSLGMSVVAEGVETKEQVNFLLKNQCDLIQGYYYSRPLPIDKFEELVLSSTITTDVTASMDGHKLVDHPARVE